MAHAQNCNAPRRVCPVVRPRRPEGGPPLPSPGPAASHGAAQDGATDMAPRPLDRAPRSSPPAAFRTRAPRSAECVRATRRTRRPAPPASAARPTNGALQGSCVRSPFSRRFISTTARSRTPRRISIAATWSLWCTAGQSRHQDQQRAAGRLATPLHGGASASSDLDHVRRCPLNSLGARRARQAARIARP